MESWSQCCKYDERSERSSLEVLVGPTGAASLDTVEQSENPGKLGKNTAGAKGIAPSKPKDKPDYLGTPGKSANGSPGDTGRLKPAVHASARKQKDTQKEENKTEQKNRREAEGDQAVTSEGAKVTSKTSKGPPDLSETPCVEVVGGTETALVPGQSQPSSGGSATGPGSEAPLRVPGRCSRFFWALLGTVAFIGMIGSAVAIALNTARYNTRTVNVLRDIQNWSALFTMNSSLSTGAAVLFLDQGAYTDIQNETADRTFVTSS